MGKKFFQPEINYCDGRVKLTYDLSLDDDFGGSKRDQFWFSFDEKYNDYGGIQLR